MPTPSPSPSKPSPSQPPGCPTPTPVTPTPTTASLLSATSHFLSLLASNAPAHTLLSLFSTSHQVFIQHCPANCPHPQTSLLRGPNAVRSYFDLLATHWTRAHLRQHAPPAADPRTRAVAVRASVLWTWRKSGRAWTEDFTCTLTFDEAMQVVSLVVKTESPASTCVMRAIDRDTKVLERPTVGVHEVT